MDITQIKTMEQLAYFINANEDWMLEVSDIISRNGWKDETDTAFGICSDSEIKVVLDDNGQAVTMPIT